MADMQSFLQTLRARLRLIAFLVGAAMLGAVVYLWMSDTGEQALTPVIPTTFPVKALEHKRDVPEAIQQQLASAGVPIDQSPLNRLIADDMFSPKAVEANIERDRQAVQKIAEADAAKAAGNPQEALRLAKEALAIAPYHLRASRMVRELESALAPPPEGGAPVEGASGAPGRPGATPAVAVPRIGAPTPAAN